jgi:hypothetical protein
VRVSYSCAVLCPTRDEARTGVSPTGGSAHAVDVRLNGAGHVVVDNLDTVWRAPRSVAHAHAPPHTHTQQI